MYRLLTAFAALAACIGVMQAPALAQNFSEDALWQAYALGISIADEETLARMPEMALGEPYVLYGVGMGQTADEAQAMAVDMCGNPTCVAMGQPSQECQFLMAGLALPFTPTLAQGETFWGVLESAYQQGMVPIVRPVLICPMVGA